MTSHNSDDALASEIVSKLPQDVTRIDIHTLLPVLTTLMSHAQEVEGLSGPGKKKLVLDCLNILVLQLPFPENEIMAPVVKSVGPVACDAICTAVGKAEIAVSDLVNRTSLTESINRILSRRDKRNPGNSTTVPQRRMFGWSWTRKAPPRIPPSRVRARVLVQPNLYMKLAVV